MSSARKWRSSNVVIPMSCWEYIELDIEQICIYIVVNIIVNRKCLLMFEYMVGVTIQLAHKTRLYRMLGSGEQDQTRI